MKQLYKRLWSPALLLAMVLILAVPAHAEIYDYVMEDGKLKFDAATGTITDCGTSVISVDIPSEIYGVPVTAIGKNAFMGCDRLKHVGIPSTVTKIEQGAFRGCRQLVSITLPSSVTTLEDPSDGYAGIFYQCNRLESVTILGNIKRLSNYMFRDCVNLKNVTFENGVEEIGVSAFYNCNSLESVTIPDNVKRIETRAFQYCPNLTSVTFGSGLEHIDMEAFYETPNLSSLYFRGNAPSATENMTSYRNYAGGVMVYYPEGASGWTTPTWNGYVTRSYVLDGNSGLPSGSETTTVAAAPSKVIVLVNDREVAFDAYNIKGNNYFKLRDLAYTLSGSSARFDVTWSPDLDAILMTSDERYTPVGGEMAMGSSTGQTGVLNNSKVFLDGQAVDLTAYTIRGNNYFKLRDIGELFDFSVEWDDANHKITIDTDKPY